MHIVKYTISVALKEYKLTVARPKSLNVIFKDNLSGAERREVETLRQRSQENFKQIEPWKSPIKCLIMPSQKKGEKVFS